MENLVERHEVVQAFLDFFEAPNYLEIGVFKGLTFREISAARKVAVDPVFEFDYEAAAAEHANEIYHQVPSDEYFGSIRKPGDIFDVVYIDGLHTAEQTTRDLVNALLCTHERSIIIVDDVRPSSYAASLKSIPRWKKVRKASEPHSSGGWMGDVYRVVQFVETFVQGLSYSIVENNHGQLVAWRKPRKAVADQTLVNVGRAPYEAIFLNPAHQNRMPLEGIRQQVARDIFGAE
ncbi:class I SAM-dependent methyltransferase [Kordiimonas marina]|uniref:class I SAM-dependent methyltransferase n=1 Tax=Kordiimonas marina TaxID=2872312 RepID=UPI001FF3C46B|nr:class I SAM-dependent methyltransferase [Kordiimonas marina]MCJ9427914.1 class I SAM-dependent methyltransferase [Kordiimonas marina]